MCRGHFHHHPWDFARIRPRSSEPLARRWEDLSLIDKAAWHWTRINELALQFLATLPADRRLDLPAERMFHGDPDAIRLLFDFAGVAAPAAPRVAEVLAAPINSQRSDAFPDVEAWSPDQRRSVWEWAGDVATSLGYREDRW
jgi:hypothetical protein